jgi:hypothetical protein
MKYLVSISILAFLFGCTQDIHVETKTLATIGRETVFYSAYQTGFDNYRIEMISRNTSDTQILFTTYITDAGFYPHTLTAITKLDTVFVISRPPIELKSSKTISGINVIMIRP